MYPVLTVIIWVLCSAGVIFLMTKETNRRIAEAVSSEALPEEEQETQKTKRSAVPYAWNTGNIVLFILSILFSGICAYVVQASVTSVIFCIEMGLCYITLLGAAVVDRKCKEIPNMVSAFLAVAGIIMLAVQSIFIDSSMLYALSSLLGCFLAFAVLMIAGKMAKGGIGMGDIKLLSAVGLTAGLQVVISTLILALFCCLAGMLYMKAAAYLHKKEDTKQFDGVLPFAPFLYLGFLIMCIFKIY